MNELTEAPTIYCANCGAPLAGEFCHACGQSVRSVVRPVHQMLDDGMDLFLNVDSRIVHTLPPLLVRPGFLTLEYFAGRRQRYIAPFRLMFVLCLLAFFAFHLVVDGAISDATGEQKLDVQVRVPDNTAFIGADTAKEVQDRLHRQLDELAIARRVAPATAAATEASERRLRALANARLATLGAPALPATSTTAPAPASSSAPAPARHGLHGKSRLVHAQDDWKVDRVRIGWLPGFMNERLNGFLQHTVANLRDAFSSEDASIRQAAIGRITTGIFAVLPQAMVVMVPIFALLLKLFYVFRRRLYMEHLIVGLHSHAFLFLALLLVTVLEMGKSAVLPHAAWLGHGLGWAAALLLLWMPVYLLVMQKRIYQQGWAMTLVKYWFVGWCYFWLLSAVLGLALVLGAGQ